LTGPVLPLALAAVVLLHRRSELAAASSRRNWFFAAIPVSVAFSLYVFRNVAAYGSLGSPYGWLEWFGKDSFPAYFAYYAKPFTILTAWQKLGYARVAELTVDQLRAVVTFVLGDPLFAVGVPSLVWLSRRTPRFALTSLLFGAGILFMVCIAHHLEARYLAPLTPLCAVAAGGLVAHALAWTRGRLSESRKQWPAIGGALVLVAFSVVAIVRTSVLVRGYGAQMAAPKKCADALDFVRRNASESEPVVTANSWYLSWETERPAINAPTNGPDALAAVVQHYGARWIFTGAAVIGGLDLVNALRDPAVVSRLHPSLRFDGAECDVYRIDPAPLHP
jgi:Alg9-like mannosyltransferase family